jgi:hypothetical protein
MPRVTRSKELSVKLGNAIGVGASLFTKLKAADVNIAASCCYQIESEALFSFVPDDAERACEILEAADLKPTVQDVLLVETPDKVGAFAEVLQRISAIGVHVRSAYATATKTDRALTVIKTEDDERVVLELDDGHSSQGV